MSGANREDRDRGTMEKMGRSVGGMAGRAAGAAADAAADAAAEAGGAMIRGAAEVLGGWWSGDEARETARSWDEERDRRSRQHFEGAMETSAGSGSVSADYEAARPYYRLGHTAGRNPDYADRSFDEVEPELRRVWDERETAAGAGEEEEQPGWPTLRGCVRFGYQEGGRAD